MDSFKLFEQKRKVKQLFTALIFLFVLFAGWYIPLLGYFIPLCMLLGVGIGLGQGRKWCDWYCPRGSFYDAFVSRISPKRQIPGVVKNMYVRVGILFFLMLVMAYHLVKRWPSPTKIGMFFAVMVTTTTVFGVILALLFHQRTWCSVCPIGTVVHAIGKNKYVVEIDSDLCVECKLCSKVCPVQITPYAFKAAGSQIVRDSDCLKCGLCVAICPKKALAFKKT